MPKKRKPANRTLQIESLENREVFAADDVNVADFACVDDTPQSWTAEVAPAAALANSAGGTQAFAVLPDLSGFWHGRMTQTNPLGSTTYNVTLKFQANPEFTSVFTGTMWAGGSSRDFHGSLNKSGRIVINLPNEGIFIINQLVGTLDSQNHMKGDVNIVDSHGGQTDGTFEFIRGEAPDVVATSMRWNNTAGGLSLRYDILDEDLPSGTGLETALFWASGTTRGKAISRINVGRIPAPRLKGSYTFNIPGWKLRNAPQGTTHILLVADPENEILDRTQLNNVFALPDVVLKYEENARQVLSPKTVGIIKDALRYAGQKLATITSTFREPIDQARAIYGNIKNIKPNSLLTKADLQKQYDLYTYTGADKIFDAYIIEHNAYIRAKALDPTKEPPKYVQIMAESLPAKEWIYVSDHCKDFTKLQTVDISPLRKKGTTNLQLLHRAFVSDSKFIGITPATKNGRISKLLDPISHPKAEPAFHIQVPQT